jgi:hypothetical protein
MSASCRVSSHSSNIRLAIKPWPPATTIVRFCPPALTSNDHPEGDEDKDRVESQCEASQPPNTCGTEVGGTQNTAETSGTQETSSIIPVRGDRDEDPTSGNYERRGRRMRRSRSRWSRRRERGPCRRVGGPCREGGAVSVIAWRIRK